MRERNRQMITDDGRWPAERETMKLFATRPATRWGSVSAKTGEKKKRRRERKRNEDGREKERKAG
jgi:hypothetical protein